MKIRQLQIERFGAWQDAAVAFGRVIDVEGWQPEEVAWGPSMWGHDRLSMTPEQRAEARAIRIAAAASGLRRPVNVIEGNYKLAPGVCPWWDGVARGEAAE